MMKKILQLLVAFFSMQLLMAQIPTVSSPTFSSSNPTNAITVQFNVTPNGTATTKVLVSTNPANLTNPIACSTFVGPSVTGSTPQVVSITVPCLTQGTNYYFKPFATNASGEGTVGYEFSATLSATNQSTSSITSQVSFHNSAQINYAITVPSGAGNTFTTINYGTDSQNLNLSQTASATTNTANVSRILTGLNPNTTYFYEIETSSNGGCTKSAKSQFNTSATPVLLYDFPFNGNLNSTINSGSLSSTATVSYESNGTTANNALTVAIADNDTARATAPMGTLSLLPTGSASRSMAMRVNFKTVSAVQEFIAGWGSPSNGQAFGLVQTNTKSSIYNWGQVSANLTYDYLFSPVANTWYDVVITQKSDGTSKLYINNLVYNSILLNVPNTTGQTFVLGRSMATNFGSADFAIDNLKIYSGELSITDIPSVQGTLAPALSSIANLAVTQTSFNVQYGINPNGVATDVRLFWGTSASNLNNVIYGNNFTGSTNQFSAFNLSGLTQGTTYYYKVEAINVFGQTTIVTGSCTTSSPPSLASISGVVVSNVTATGATIDYTVNPNFATTSAYVLWGLSNSQGDLVNNLPINNSITSTSNFTQNFTGLTPNTTYYYRVVASNSQGDTFSPIQSFIFNAVPTITNGYVTNILDTSARINYTINANNANTTPTVAYGIGGLTNTSNGTVITGATAVNGFVNITGLTPNTNYQFRVQASNASGNATPSATLSFTTATSATTASGNPIYHFPFDGNLADITGTGKVFQPYATAPTYTTDRNGNANSAVLFNNIAVAENLPALPLGEESRSVSVWVKFNDIANTSHNIFGYGTDAPDQGYAFQQQGNNGSGTGVSAVRNLGGSNAPSHISQEILTLPNVWYHYVFVYEKSPLFPSSGTTTIYRDGTAIKQQGLVNRNTNGTNFIIGRYLSGTTNSINAVMDDLKIFSSAITPAQVATLGTSDFNKESLKLSLYPNPAKDSFAIDMESELKSVEIYSILGTKILSSNAKEINVSQLQTGTYMVKITDENGKVATQKLVKK